MISIAECENLLRNDPDINSLILNSSALKRKYKLRLKPKRNGAVTTKSSLAMKYFMQVDGVKFRQLLENRGINPFSTSNMSAVQCALVIILQELIDK